MSDTTTPPLVERLARAMYAKAPLEHDCRVFAWEDLTREGREQWLDLARAALAALAEEAGGADALRYTDGVIEDSYNHAVDEMRHTRVAALLRTLAEAAHG